MERAVFAGGCFWGMQDLIRRLPGVSLTRVGYTGGTVPNATYEKLKRGNTGHAESIEVFFDPAKLSYRQLLAKAELKPTDVFDLWRQRKSPIGTSLRL